MKDEEYLALCEMIARYIKTAADEYFIKDEEAISEFLEAVSHRTKRILKGDLIDA